MKRWSFPVLNLALDSCRFTVDAPTFIRIVSNRADHRRGVVTFDAASSVRPSKPTMYRAARLQEEVV